MANKGLLFIPDISGFTRFVNETEIDHSRLIIQELLEVIINANDIGLEISEIEGDAILFYRFGEAPDLKKLFSQVEKMFCEFHRNIIAYENRRFCQCQACRSAVNLTLKVITHYGEFTGYNVKQFSKLIGRDIIVAHQLLKNEIDEHEYWLVTNGVSESPDAQQLAEWLQWNKSIKTTEHGDIPFHYAQLSRLKSGIPPQLFPLPDMRRKMKMFSISRNYQANIIALFHATGDFHYRSQWQEGVKSVEELSHYLPRIGQRCKFITDEGEVNVYANSYVYDPEKIEFSETNESANSTTRFILEKLDDQSTRVTLEYYLEKNIFKKWLFLLGQKQKLERSMRTSLERLDGVAKSITL